jgi:hypothetical protein
MQTMLSAFLTAAGLVACLPAQGWTLSAARPTPATASAGVLPSVTTNTQPAGPVQPGAIVAVAGGGPGASASAGASWQPSVAGQTALLAFSVSCQASASYSGSGFGLVSASVSATLDVTLAAPQLTGGRLVLSGTQTSFGGSGGGSIGVDVAGDGLIDYQVPSPQSAAGLPVDVLVPAGVSLIRVTLAASFSVVGTPNNGGTGLTLSAQFFPGQVAVSSFDTTGAGTTLVITRPAASTVSIALPTFLQTPVLLAFGMQPTQVPLAPSVTQLVTLDSVFAVGSMTLTLPPLPPGTELYCQGLVLQFGTFRSSNSVRAVWP